MDTFDDAFASLGMTGWHEDKKALVAEKIKEFGNLLPQNYVTSERVISARRSGSLIAAVIQQDLRTVITLKGSPPYHYEQIERIQVQPEDPHRPTLKILP